jgi:hypothetical protein
MKLQPRRLLERRAAAVEHLLSNSDPWLATARTASDPGVYWWDGTRLTTATFESSRTLKNVRAQPKGRVAVGSTGDVLIVDATATIVAVTDIDPGAAEGYAQASGNDPRSVPGFTYIQLAPERMQVGKGAKKSRGGR